MYFFSLCYVFVLLKPSEPENPRALAQVLPDVQTVSESCRIETCKKLFDEIQAKIFYIEQNLFEEMNLLRRKLEDYERGRISQQIET